MYILFFYFFMLLYVIYFFLVSAGEVFSAFIEINIGLILSGSFVLIFVLCEAYYNKAFLALSSILNTLFIFLTFGAGTAVHFMF